MDYTIIWQLSLIIPYHIKYDDNLNSNRLKSQNFDNSRFHGCQKLLKISKEPLNISPLSNNKRKGKTN